MVDTLLETFKKWDALKHAKENQLKDIVYFYGFQVVTDDDSERKSGALFLTTDDEMFAVGYNNDDNLLALTDENFAKPAELTTPKKIKELSGLKIKKLAVAERFGAAITGEGKLIYWGMEMKMLQYEEKDKKYVRLPHEPRENFRAVDMACGAHSITFITDGGEIFIWGCVNLYYNEFYNFKPITTRKNVNIKSVCCGWYHVALMDQNGNAWTFGYGSVGQLGYNWSASENGYTTPRKVPLPHFCTKVECGAYSTLFLLQNGNIYACGSNSKTDHLCVARMGYVVTPEKVLLEDRITDIAATYAWSGRWQSLFGAYSEDSNKYYKWGNDSNLETPLLSSDTHTFLDTFANFKTPPSVANISWSNSIDLSVNMGAGLSNSVHTSSTSSQRRRFFDHWEMFDNVTDDFLSKIEYFVVITSVPQNFVGQAYFCYVVTKSDDVYSWSNDKRIDLLGQPEETALTFAPVKMDSLSQKRVKKILVNYNEGLALTRDGSVYSWSNTKTPQKLTEVGDLRVEDIAAEISGSYFITETNTVFFHRNGDDLSLITIPTDDQILTFECGEHHCAVLTERYNVYTFGNGRWGQLGYELVDADYSEDAREVTLPGACKKVACGIDATFFLLGNGELYACGINSAADVLAVGHRNTVFTPEKVVIKEPIVDVAVSKRHNNISARGSIVAVQTVKGEFYKWGGQFHTPTLVEGITMLVEVFENVDIPQSMSLVHIASDPDYENDSEDDEPTRRGTTDGDNNLFGDPLYSDLDIKLVDSTVAAHRFILHTKSSFFQKKLMSNKLKNRNQLDLSSYNPKSIIALLKHTYGLPIGTDASTLKDLIDFHEVAKMEGDGALLSESEKLLSLNLMRIAMKELLSSSTSEDREKIPSRLLPDRPFP